MCTFIFVLTFTTDICIHIHNHYAIFFSPRGLVIIFYIFALPLFILFPLPRISALISRARSYCVRNKSDYAIYRPLIFVYVIYVKAKYVKLECNVTAQSTTILSIDLGIMYRCRSKNYASGRFSRTIMYLSTLETPILKKMCWTRL